MALKYASPAIGFHVESGSTLPTSPVHWQLYMLDGQLMVYDANAWVWKEAWGSGGIWAAPITEYDWELIEWVFEEIQFIKDTTISWVIWTLEVLPDWNTAGTDDITTVALEYTNDWWATWTTLTTINFAETDTTTNWIDIQTVDLTTVANLTANTRLRFNVTQTAVNFAGANLKIYLK